LSLGQARAANCRLDIEQSLVSKTMAALSKGSDEPADQAALSGSGRSLQNNNFI
jgi:hypothetical protein